MAGGPSTKDVTTLALGLADIRINTTSAQTNAEYEPFLTEVSSLGSLANTKFTSEAELWKHSSGFPPLEDYSVPLKETAVLEASFEEITPSLLWFGWGFQSPGFMLREGDHHSGEFELGYFSVTGRPITSSGMPRSLRVEAHYTFPDADSRMYIVLPYCMPGNTTEVDLKKEDNAAVTFQFSAQRVDTNLYPVWNGSPLGHIFFKSGEMPLKGVPVYG